MLNPIDSARAHESQGLLGLPDAHVGEALRSSFEEVISTMFGLSLEGPEMRTKAVESHLNITGMIGLAGPEFRGLLRVACTQTGARKLATALLGDESLLDDDPNMLIDSLGELANILGGTFKRNIDSSGVKIELSLPSVLEGEGTLFSVGATGNVEHTWKVDGLPVVTSLIFGSQQF